MGRVLIMINTDNAAFGEDVDDRQEELSRILNDLAFRFDTEDDVIYNKPYIKDSNGNRVGEISYTE